MGRTYPEFAEFNRLAESGGQGTLVTMYRRLLADQLTPVLAYRRLVEPDDRLAPSFLLESVVDGERIARYSFLGSRPVVELIAHGQDVEIKDHRYPQRSRKFHSPDPLKELERLTAGWHVVSGDRAPKPDFAGGWLGLAGYDTVRYLEGESLPHPPRDDRGLPDLHMGLYRHVVVFDQVQKTVLVLTQVLLEEHANVEAAYAAGQAELEAIVAKIERQRLTTPPGSPELAVGEVELETPPPQLPLGNMGAGQYQSAVEKCKQYISAGDIFQVVVSQRFELETQADPFDIYRALRVVNPSPYMFYVQIDGGMLIGSSPEILCRVRGGQVVNRPLAGTRRRGKTDTEDKALEAELLADPKERAEHIMLVDLGRNDLGRVAVPGSVRLPEVMVVERYSHVMHISSTVVGQMREGMTCWDALRYTLPVGTVSGAPKVRAMQIIDDLEPTRRGPYAGAVGYADFSGNMDMAIGLRTMVVMPGRDKGTWRVHVQAGAGIVADSVPDLEHKETVSKAAALAKAVEVAEKAFAKK
ncbi:MAG: anthranilate synthase component I [Phycisphaeraceae bacterium]|nr:anthranilate synthase component I [Phycisphaeraceae bacterium]